MTTAFDPAAHYHQGDTVTYLGKTYRADRATVGHVPPAPPWEEVAAGGGGGGAIAASRLSVWWQRAGVGIPAAQVNSGSDPLVNPGWNAPDELVGTSVTWDPATGTATLVDDGVYALAAYFVGANGDGEEFGLQLYWSALWPNLYPMVSKPLTAGVGGGVAAVTYQFPADTDVLVYPLGNVTGPVGADVQLTVVRLA